MSDVELFERIKQGDGDALAELYERYIQKVASISRRLFGVGLFFLLGVHLYISE